MEKLKLGAARATASAASPVSNVDGQWPEHEPGQQLQSEDVDAILCEMKQTRLIPNVVAILDGLCKNGLVQEAMKLFGPMGENCHPVVVIYTAIVEAFSKAAKLIDAMRIFKKMQGNGFIPDATG